MPCPMPYSIARKSGFSACYRSTGENTPALPDGSTICGPAPVGRSLPAFVQRILRRSDLVFRLVQPDCPAEAERPASEPRDERGFMRPARHGRPRPGTGRRRCGAVRTSRPRPRPAARQNRSWGARLRTCQHLPAYPRDAVLSQRSRTEQIIRSRYERQ